MDSETTLTNFRFSLSEPLQELLHAGSIDEHDIQRLQSDNKFCMAFLNHARGDLETAVELVKTCFKWRKSESIANLSSASFSREMLENGGLYFHSEDRDGHPILYMRIKDHVRSAEYSEQVKRYVIWLLEKQHKLDAGLQVIVLFDMSGAGLKNLDLDQVKFIITCFQTYYPNYLARLLVYELPFILNAGWRIIQAWLSETARKKVTFAQRKDIQDYIEPSKLWVHMGGSDNYKHMYTPPEETSSLTSSFDVVDVQTTNEFTSIEGESLDSVTRNRNYSRSSSQENRSRRKSLHTTSSKSMNIRDRSQENSFTGRFMTVCPADHLVFSPQLGQQLSADLDCSEKISLTNNQDQPVVFKIKTTCPTDYRIRPSAGIIAPANSLDVDVSFRPSRPADSTPSSTTSPGGPRNNDKIQILALPAPMNMSLPEALLLIKSTPKESIMEHRLYCRFSQAGEESLPEEVTLEYINNKLTKMQDKLNQMEANMELLAFFLKTLIVLVIAALLVTTFRLNLR